MRQTHPNRARAMALMGVRRFREAEEELRRALRDNPDDAGLHSLLATCLVEDPARGDEAEREALVATTLSVDQPFPWYVASRVLARRKRFQGAEQAARIAVGLNPESAELLAQLSAAELDLGRADDGLATALRGLEADPEHTACAILAAGVLSRRGKHDEARGYLDRALAREPENAGTHFEVAWAALRRGAADTAVRHFHEALRLDPRWPAPRDGLLEAMRARNPVYRALLRASMRVPGIPSQMKWLAIGGGLIAVLFLPVLADEVGLPEWTALPFQAAVVAAVLLTWTARSVLDAALFLDPLGRKALSTVEVACAFATALALAAAAALACLSIFGEVPGTGLGAILLALVTIPIAATLRARSGWPRRVLAVYTLGTVVLAAVATAGEAAGENVSALFGLAVGAMAMSDLVAEELSAAARRSASPASASA
ncbi:MAG TPA: tetratricopeptide repeat protein [Longimicrobium sp.]|nr:tetratricopeptide repeat protein [Longimicrobium sp.]